MGKRIKFLQGFAVGVASQYFYDPQAGRSRRARLRNQTASELRKLGRKMGKKAKYQIGRSKGLRHRLMTG